MYGVWQVPTAATISPIGMLLDNSQCPTSQLPSPVWELGVGSLEVLLVHRPIDLIEQRHRRQHAGGAGLRLTAFANRRDELDVLAIERRHRIERHFLAFAVGHRVAIDLVGL